jgi:putative ABC transport system substrate-binding protein
MIANVRRRDFITLLGGAAAAWPLATGAQQADRMPLIGALMGFAETDPTAQSWLAEFRGGLAKRGWTEGSNLRIELRWGASDAERIKRLAKELVDLQPVSIFGQTTPVIDALARETRTIPIVFAAVADPIGSGFATSFAHPGGNITGFTSVDPTLGGKWVELLKEIAPRTVRMALLFNSATAAAPQFFMPSIQAAAASFAVEVSATPVHSKEEIEGVIAAQARTPRGGIIVMPDVFEAAHRGLIIALAARYGVPTIYFTRFFAESGGLISYGDDRAEPFRQAAEYMDHILKGAKAADLPVQAPVKFEMVINLKTAKALGLDMPASVVARADEVIE